MPMSIKGCASILRTIIPTTSVSYPGNTIGNDLLVNNNLRRRKLAFSLMPQSCGKLIASFYRGAAVMSRPKAAT
jgi:hypothetical protein